MPDVPGSGGGECRRAWYPCGMAPPPFLLLASRDIDEVADDEHGSIARHLGVAPDDVARVRMERGPFTPVDLTGVRGVLLGGSAFTTITPPDLQSALQRRVEAELATVFEQLAEADVPFLGLCYGVGTLGRFAGGTVDGAFAENTAAATLTVTAAGRADPLLAGVPDEFLAFVGHKEALSALPQDARLLVTGTACPFQMWRLGRHRWVTQFHPEMDNASLLTRMRAYRTHGYFAPETFDALAAQVAGADVAAAHLVLRNFARYALSRP